MTAPRHPPHEVEVEIHDLSGSGAGVGRLDDGRVIFVPRTAPGDRVRALVVHEKRRFVRGRLSARLVDAPGRRTAPCALYDRCGGCQLQHLEYAAQTAWKGRRIAETLRRVGEIDLAGVPGFDGEAVEVEGSPEEWFYRNRVRFTLRRVRGGRGPDGGRERPVGPDTGPVRPPRVLAGFHEVERPNRIVDVGGECRLPEPAIGQAWAALRDRWGVEADRLPAGEELQLTLRTAVDGVVLLIEGGGTRDRAGRAEAERWVEEIEELVAVWHRPGAADRFELLAGDPARTDRWLGEVVPVGSRAFLQVNRGLGERLHRDVLEEVREPDGLRIVDAYCGVGAWGRSLARAGASVIGLELDADAVEAARRDAPPRLTLLRGRVEELLPDLEDPDLLLVNPPRAGVDAAVTDWIRERAVERVIWVSCDPATLARDLARLGPGWEITRIRGYDLFPQTAHVETMVSMRRRPTDATL